MHPFSANSNGKLSSSPMAPFLAAILFVVALLPWAANFVSFHPDERHYTNGALFMMQSGDAITPRAGDGESRFKKPILTYWAVLGSYHLFGVSAFSSRLPFLAAGAVIVWLTYRMGILLFASRRTALVASMIMASNPLLMMAGVRSNPDMLLTLWLLVSASGFLGIMLSVKPSLLRYLAAYVGIGLAVATKGPFPGLAFALVSMGYLLFNPWRRVSLGHLIHLPAMLLGIAIGSAWFVATYLLHGSPALASFMGDHVGNRVAFQWMDMLGHLAAATASVSLLFIPWFFHAMAARLRYHPEAMGDSGDRIRAVEGFVMAWVVAIILMSVPVGSFFSRYVLPVLPLVALLLAEALSRADGVERKSWGWARGWALMMVLLLILLLIGAGLIGMAMAPDSLATLGLGLAVPLLYTVLSWRGKGFDYAVTTLAAALLMVPLFLFLLLYSVVLPDQGSQIAQKLDRLGLIGQGAVLYLGEAEPAAKIRIAAGPDLDLREVDQITADDAVKAKAVVILASKVDRADLKGMVTEQASASWSDLPLPEIKASRTLMELKEALSHPDQKHLVVWWKSRKTTAGDGAP